MIKGKFVQTIFFKEYFNILRISQYVNISQGLDMLIKFLAFMIRKIFFFTQAATKMVCICTHWTK